MTEETVETADDQESHPPAKRPSLALLGILAALVAIVPVTFLLRRAGDPAPQAVAAKNRPAPNFTLEALDGSTLDLASLRGKPVIVNFWASWCVPCRKEFPILAQALRDHSDEGLQMVGIVYRDLPGDARQFGKKYDVDWPLLIDPDGDTATAFRVQSIPTTFFIDADGMIRSFVYGQLTTRIIDKQLAALARSAG